MIEQRRSTPAKVLLPASRWRYLFILTILMVAVLLLIARIIDLQVITQKFLQDQGNNRTIRLESIDSHRGMITDRNGEPLAVSTPVITLWANPRELPTDENLLQLLAQKLQEPIKPFLARIASLRERSFIYLKRQISPAAARPILDLHLPGIYASHEYKRYYPAGEVTAQLIGVTNIDDHGQEGLELAYDQWLSGKPGLRRVLKDRHGTLVRDLHLVRSAKAGGDLQLSISLKLQYLAYRQLAQTVAEHQASAGSLVMMDAQTGEVLALANVPSFNPNNRADFNPQGLRNRSITDAFEPGSVVKPLAMLAILNSGRFSPQTVIDTSPGWMVVDHYTIHDVHNYGPLTLTGIITKSSNIGMTKLVLQLPNDVIWQMYNALNFGQSLGTGFPGEATGSLPAPYDWSDAKRATLAYGYGLSVSALQLASAYTVIANHGDFITPSLLKISALPKGKTIVKPAIAKEVLAMMETVIGPYGGGGRAAIDGYRVAGKTGTVRKIGQQGYDKNSYRSNFVGIAPVSNPRLIVVISIDNSRQGGYYGSMVAAPLFAQVAGAALRLLDIPPDNQLPANEPVQQNLEQARRVTGIKQAEAAISAAKITPSD